MEIYDIDKDLNKLLNEPGMNDALKKLRHAILWWQFLGYGPIAILVLGACISTYHMQCCPAWASILIFAITLILAFVVSYVLKNKLDRHYIEKFFSINNDIYQKMYNERYCYNWEYLVFILEKRIQQSKRTNDVYKKSITIVLTLLGIKALYPRVNLWSVVFGNAKLSSQLVLSSAAFIVFLLLVVSVIVEIYDCLINNSVKSEKWSVLLNHANKLKIESKRSQN